MQLIEAMMTARAHRTLRLLAVLVIALAALLPASARRTGRAARAGREAVAKTTLSADLTTPQVQAGADAAPKGARHVASR